MSLGIIGLGRLGKVLAEIFSKDYDVKAYDPIDYSEHAKKLGVRFCSLEETSACEIVVFCVPVSDFEMALKSTLPFLQSDALVIDTCSVKEYPIEVMKKILPDTIQIIGMHPLFGPDSKDISKRIVICPVRTSRSEELVKFFQKRGFFPINTTPEEHDRQIAKAINLVHLIGRGLDNAGFGEQEIITLNYAHLLKVIRTVKNDSMKLFEDAQKYNRFAHQIEKKFLDEAKDLSEIGK